MISGKGRLLSEHALRFGITLSYLVSAPVMHALHSFSGSEQVQGRGVIPPVTTLLDPPLL